jgi:NhaA family Na+:H+ antiporter
MANRKAEDTGLDIPAVDANGAVPPRSRGEVVVRASRSYVARRVVLPSQAFVHMEEVGGLVLLAAAVLALAWANSPWSDAYHAILDAPIALAVGPWTIEQDLRHWINDGLMTFFFFVIGLEVRRETTIGALAERRRAALPVAAAVGGMVVPGIVCAAIAGAGSWGIPVATDIAFALGVLALASRRLPEGARVLLLALAVADDIGGTLLIAIVYSSGLSIAALGAAAVGLVLAFALRAGGVRNMVVYFGVGLATWGAVYVSGVHPTIAGVALGLLAPIHRDFGLRHFARSAGTLLARFRTALDREDHATAAATLGQVETLSRGTEAPVERLERVVHPWVSFLVLPLFALANAGVALSGEMLMRSMSSPITLGVMAGLVVGKPVGIVGASWLAVRMGWADLPDGTTWRHMLGIGLLAGIGFTVALFIGELAFQGGQGTDEAKAGILAGSFVAGGLGYLWLRFAASSRGDQSNRRR